MDLKKIFRTLDFDKIECAAGVDLSEEAHAAIQRLGMNMLLYTCLLVQRSIRCHASSMQAGIAGDVRTP